MSFTIGSLFDGSGGFPLAASLCGGTPKWASEIEPYPIAVTKSRFPDVKHLGSVTDIKGGEVEPVDVITFGSPCQDLSVAGKRAGLKHTDNGDDETTRSGLFMEAVRIIKEMREATNGVYPRFAVWENVPGAFSSNKGEDFRIVLQELIQVVEPTAVMPEVPKNGWPYADSYCGDGWSIAYRVLDAQYWGVPQRRRRIYLVADFRGECAGKVSFEREGLRGYFETGRTPWQTVARDAESGSGTADCETECCGLTNRGLYSGDIAETLRAESHGAIPMVSYSINHQGGNVEQIVEAVGFDGYNSTDTGDKASTLGVNCGMSTGRNGVVVPYTLKIRSGCEGGGKGALIQEDLSATLATNNDQYLFQPIGIVDSIGGQAERGWEGETAPCLKASHYKFAPVVAYSVENHPADSRVNIDESGKVQTLTSRMGTGGGNVPIVMEPQLASGGNVTGRLMASGYDKLGAQEMFSGDYTVIEKQAIPIHDQATRFSGKHGDKADGKGNGLGVGNPGDPMNTLTSGDRHAVAYWDGGQTMATLTANNAGGNQRMPDKENFNCVIESHVVGTDVGWMNSEDDTCPTLLARMYKDPHLVTYGVDARNSTEYPELTGALQADAAHNLNSNNVVRIQYIVRRLTPTECARLQGFPDFWGHPNVKTELTDEEYQFWLNVRNTHAAINGKAVKDYTKDQILKWYNGLHTDSSEYKMWGNGIALPNALYVMQGIADVMSEEKATRRKWLNDLLGDCL